MNHIDPVIHRPRRLTDAQRAKAWEKRIWREYGLTPNDVARQWGEQDGRCPICECDLMEKRWVIDHDHKTGRFRGILCAWDNHRIISMIERGGRLRARNALRYLWDIDMENWTE